MLITISCPTCNRQSQIQSEHKGRRLKCPYPDCRHPFVVGADDVAVPFLEEPVEVGGPQVMDWSAAAPPQREPAPPVREPVADWQRMAPPPRQPAVAEAPVAAEWSPPPVRRGGAEPVQEEVLEVSEAAVEDGVVYEEPVHQPVSHGDDYTHRVSRSKRTRKYMIGIAAVGLIMCIVVGVMILQLLAKQEANLAAKGVNELMEKENFPEAIKIFEELVKKHPRSRSLPDYQYHLDLANFRYSCQGVAQAANAVTQYDELKKKYGNTSRWKGNQEHVWKGLTTMVDLVAHDVRTSADEARYEAGKKALEFAKSEGLGVADFELVAKTHEKLDGLMATAERSVSRAKSRQGWLARAEELFKEQKPGSVEAAQSLHEELVKQFPELANDNALKDKLEAFRREEAGWISYTPHNERLKQGPPPDAGEGMSVLVCPLIQGKPSDAKDSVVTLVLDRGVVYAITENSGEVRWAARVGLDTTTTPVRLPGRTASQELALLLSQGNTLVTAIEVQTGRVLWHHHLGESCPAGPTLVGQPAMAYFPTTGGRIIVLDPVEARLVGSFETGQPMTVPGVYDGVRRRLYQPAARKRIYVLDLAQNRCAGVVYTGHSVGGLRGAPVVAANALVIAEASGLTTMSVRAFGLTETGTETTPLADFKVKGWSWFPPYFDGDNLGYVTDRGYLAVFGLARGTGGPAIFRQCAEDLPIGGGQRGTSVAQSPVGRSQIARVELNRWWLLNGGMLQPYVLDVYRQTLAPSTSDKPLALGIPFQEAQSIDRGRKMLVVSQAAAGSQGLDRSFATAVDLNSGQLQWQRQLGMVTSIDPVVVGDQVFVVDKVGGLWRLDAKALPTAPDQKWLTSGEWLANGAEEPSVPKLVASPDGKFVVALNYLTVSNKIVIRRYDLGKGLTETEYPLDSPPVGTPAVNDRAVYVPCRNGSLREFPFAFTRTPPAPLAWRTSEASGLTVGHAVLVTPDQLFINDGGSRLLRWDYGVGGNKFWQNVERGGVGIRAQINTPTVLVPGPNNEQMLCFGDDSGTLHLFSATSLQYVRGWSLRPEGVEGQETRITHGPFVRGNRIGCIVNDVKLVWIDPAADAPLWEFTARSPIRGAAAQVGNLVVVAELEGTFTWLDLAKGAPVHQYALKSGTIPATGPAPLGSDRALVPLSDGTMLIVAPTSTP